MPPLCVSVFVCLLVCVRVSVWHGRVSVLRLRASLPDSFRCGPSRVFVFLRLVCVFVCSVSGRASERAPVRQGGHTAAGNEGEEVGHCGRTRRCAPTHGAAGPRATLCHIRNLASSGPPLPVLLHLRSPPVLAQAGFAVCACVCRLRFNLSLFVFTHPHPLQLGALRDRHPTRRRRLFRCPSCVPHLPFRLPRPSPLF